MRIPAAIYRSISPDSSSPADPSKFLPLSFTPSSAGFLDICEPPHVWMSRRNGAANPERHGARVAREPCRESESRVRECHRSKSTWCTRICYERTRTRICEWADSAPRRAYVINVAAHVASGIFRPRIPFSILAKVAIRQPSCVRPAQNSRARIRSALRPISILKKKSEIDWLPANKKSQMAIKDQKSISFERKKQQTII